MNNTRFSADAGFRMRVKAVVRNIPKGKTMSYGEVAKIAGRPQAARAVGSIMASNRDPSVPCHRVIGADGRLTGYAGGLDRKRWLLRHEGLRIDE